MIDSLIQIFKGVLEFLGLLAGPEKKVEEILPDKSESEKALEQLQQSNGKAPPSQ